MLHLVAWLRVEPATARASGHSVDTREVTLAPNHMTISQDVRDHSRAHRLHNIDVAM